MSYHAAAGDGKGLCRDARRRSKPVRRLLRQGVARFAPVIVGLRKRVCPDLVRCRVERQTKQRAATVLQNGHRPDARPRRGRIRPSVEHGIYDVRPYLLRSARAPECF